MNDDQLAGETLMRVRSNEAEAVATADADGDHEYLERWTGDPMVTIRGRLAAVWGEYEYWIDGEFSHCGIDAAQHVKVDDTWKIANWTWTVEPEGCPTDPSRQAQEPADTDGLITFECSH